MSGRASVDAVPLPAMDVDLVAERATMEAIGPFVSDRWRQFLAQGGGIAGFGAYALPGVPYPPQLTDAAVDDPHAAVARHLDARALDRAILEPGNAGSLSGLANVVMAAELARATNDWLLDEWVERHDRLAASIVVTPRDAGLAADEVERLGAHPRVAQVLLASPPCLLGDRSLRPLLAAAEAHGLPILLRAEGAYAGRNRGVSAVGHPTSRWEYELDLAWSGPVQLLSSLCEGVFDRFPSLRLVMGGFGVAWLPALLWRADREVHAGRTRPPRTLTRLPSELVAEHVRFTTEALEVPDDPAHLTDLLASIGGASLLLFASGPLPEPASRLPIDALPHPWREQALRENAHALYGARDDRRAARAGA